MSSTTTFKKACLQHKPFVFVNKKFDDGIYKVEASDLMQWCGKDYCNPWRDAFAPIEWIVECVNKKVEILTGEILDGEFIKNLKKSHKKDARN